jgi:hypothetical protein
MVCIQSQAREKFWNIRKHEVAYTAGLEFCKRLTKLQGLKMQRFGGRNRCMVSREVWRNLLSKKGASVTNYTIEYDARQCRCRCRWRRRSGCFDTPDTEGFRFRTIGLINVECMLVLRHETTLWGRTSAVALQKRHNTFFTPSTMPI